MAALEKVRDAELTRRRRPPGAAGRLPPTSLGTRVDAVRERRSRAGTQEGVAELSDVGRNLSGSICGAQFLPFAEAFPFALSLSPYVQERIHADGKCTRPGYFGSYADSGRRGLDVCVGREGLARCELHRHLSDSSWCGELFKLGDVFAHRFEQEPGVVLVAADREVFYLATLGFDGEHGESLTEVRRTAAGERAG